MAGVEEKVIDAADEATQKEDKGKGEEKMKEVARAVEGEEKVAEEVRAKMEEIKVGEAAKAREEDVKLEVEPKTGVSFPVKLADGKQLNAMGLRKKKILALGINIYAFGMYADNAKLKELLKAKFGKALQKTSKELYDVVINSDVGMVVRLVIVFGALTMNLVRKNFDEGLGASIKKLTGGQKNEDLVNKVMGAAKDSIKLSPGSVIEITRLPGYVLQTKDFWTQLKLMTPCIVVAGSLGIGFGYLTAEGDDIIPSLSPSMTSISIIVSCIVYVLMMGSSTSSTRTALSGELISCGASVGAILQWIIMVMIHEKSGYESDSISWKDYFKDRDVHKLFALMLPAIVSSGLVQIASLTDLYFSSFIPGAAAGLSYAHLLAMAPLGILSSTIVLPMLPLFSRLAKSSSWKSLKKNLQKAILMCMVIILPITCTICVLSGPIISILFQRFIFDSNASSFVSSLLLCFSIGSPFWIIRELFVVVFYSIGDGKWPFLINLTATLLNGILDWLLITVFSLGAQGLALSTSCVTALSVLAFMLLLPKKIRGIFNLREMDGPLLILLACCIISGFTTMICHRLLQSLFSAISMSRFCRITEVMSVSLAGFLGMSAFYVSLVFFQFPEVILLKTLLNRLAFFVHS